MNDYSGRENLSQCVRSLFGCCLGKCCDSTAAAPGVDPQHPYFAETDTTRVHIEPLSQAVLPVTLQPGVSVGLGQCEQEGGAEHVGGQGDQGNPGLREEQEGALEGSVPRSKIRFSETLGHGWFGWVVSGTVAGATKTVVKILREEAKPEDFDRFTQEHDIWASTSHPNVMSVVGKCFNSFPMLSLLEAVDHTSAKTFLLQLKSEEVSDDLLLQLATDACAGLAALHSKSLVVPDLAARNCMITEQRLLKIGDYGLGRAAFPNDYWPLLRESVPLRWSAPRQLERQLHHSLPTYSKPKLEDNLWSLAILIWEIVNKCKQQPFGDLDNSGVVELLLSSRQLHSYLPAIPPCALRNRALLAISAQGFAVEPQYRPSAAQMEEKLHQLSKASSDSLGQILVEAQGEICFREVDIR